MNINYLAILVSSVLSMIVGAIWYGPLFGRKWAEIVGMDMSDATKVAEMKRGANKLYAIQFLITLFQVWVLSYYINGTEMISPIQNSIWIWAGFILPTIAGTAMWNNDSSKIAWSRFFVQGGYQLILFIIFGLVLGNM